MAHYPQKGCIDMGLKTINYQIKEKGITIDTAYAKIGSIYINGNKATANFAIQQSREQTESLDALEYKSVSCVIDKEKPLHEQMYVKAKEEVFKDWEDDIVEVVE